MHGNMNVKFIQYLIQQPAQSIINNHLSCISPHTCFDLYKVIIREVYSTKAYKYTKFCQIRARVVKM